MDIAVSIEVAMDQDFMVVVFAVVPVQAVALVLIVVVQVVALVLIVVVQVVALVPVLEVVEQVAREKIFMEPM